MTTRVIQLTNVPTASSTIVLNPGVLVGVALTTGAGFSTGGSSGTMLASLVLGTAVPSTGVTNDYPNVLAAVPLTLISTATATAFFSAGIYIPYRIVIPAGLICSLTHTGAVVSTCASYGLLIFE